MQRLPVARIRAGMVVGKPVLGSNGQMLLSSGMVLTDSYIMRLREKGVPSVYIQEQVPELMVDVQDVISDESRLRANVAVRDLLKDARSELAIARRGFVTLNDTQVRKSVNSLVDELLQNRDIAVNLADIRTLDNYTFGHSVQVGVLSILTGITMGYDNLKLRDLGIGAILHDIGVTRVRDDIATKAGALTPEEMAEMQKHCEYGFDMLRYQSNISILSAHVAYQHHEKHNGQGYPRGLKGDEIQEYARIVAIAEQYDSLISDRPWRPAHLPHEAVEIIAGGGDYFFDYRVVKPFLENIAVYPVGTMVELNDGTRGIVTTVQKGVTLRPRVRLVRQADGTAIRPPFEIDLVGYPTLLVSRVLTDAADVVPAASTAAAKP
ncbi:MAG: HD-GYP domain-containing protein [Symbiobacteriia bacterium]